MAWRPVHVRASSIKQWVKEHPSAEIHDAYVDMAEELFRITNPVWRPERRGYDQALEKFRSERASNGMSGEWFFYPWRNTLLRVLEESDYRRVRTARNHDIITEAEQEAIGNASVGVAGLSVGSSALDALILSGHYKQIRVADFDTLELSNLNRITGTVTDYGLPKWVGAVRRIFELDPYADVQIFEKGLEISTVDAFVKGLNVVIDAIDEVGMKVRLRESARSYGVPVVMVTDIDNPLLDVERFDLDRSQPIFHGMLTDEEIEDIKRNRGASLAIALRIIGLENMHLPLLRSLSQIGRTLASHPQLGVSARVAGAVAAHAALRIILGQPINTGRTVVGIISKIDPTYDDPREVQARMELRVAIEEAINKAERPTSA